MYGRLEIFLVPSISTITTVTFRDVSFFTSADGDSFSWARTGITTHTNASITSAARQLLLLSFIPFLHLNLVSPCGELELDIEFNPWSVAASAVERLHFQRSDRQRSNFTRLGCTNKRRRVDASSSQRVHQAQNCFTLSRGHDYFGRPIVSGHRQEWLRYFHRCSNTNRCIRMRSDSDLTMFMRNSRFRLHWLL